MSQSLRLAFLLKGHFSLGLGMNQEEGTKGNSKAFGGSRLAGEEEVKFNFDLEFETPSMWTC